jgi:hypothetical protein
MKSSIILTFVIAQLSLAAPTAEQDGPSSCFRYGGVSLRALY